MRSKRAARLRLFTLSIALFHQNYSEKCSSGQRGAAEAADGEGCLRTRSAGQQCILIGIQEYGSPIAGLEYGEENKDVKLD
jgi:hypothetical protein